MFVRLRFDDLRDVRMGIVVAALASLAAGVASHPAAAEPSSVGIIPSVVMLDPAERSSDPYISVFAAVDGNGTPSPGSTFRNLFGGKKLPAPQTTGALGEASTRKGNMNFIMVADADPHWDRWQKDAQQKLKEEVQVRIPKQHPLAIANPGKSVVVCEAGCKSTKDEIVYIAAVVPAVLPAVAAEGQLQTSSSQPPPQSQLEDGEVPCIAGCYERPQRNKPSPRRKADVAPASQPTAGQAYAALARDVLGAAFAAAPAPDFAATTHAPSRTVNNGKPNSAKFDVAQIARIVARAYVPASSAAGAAVAPQAKRRFAQRGYNGAIVETRQLAASSQKAAARGATQAKLRAGKLASLAIARGWAATVTVARGDRPVKAQQVLPSRASPLMRTRVLSRMTEAARLRRVTKTAWRVRVVEF